MKLPPFFPLFIGFICGLFLASAVWAADILYTLRPVTTYEDAALCGSSGGRAALIANLTSDGEQASEWEAYCILESK